MEEIPQRTKDSIRAFLYNKFYRDNTGLYHSDPLSYFQQCNRYVDSNYRKELEELKKQIQRKNEGKLEKGVQKPKKKWWNIK